LPARRPQLSRPAGFVEHTLRPHGEIERTSLQTGGIGNSPSFKKGTVLKQQLIECVRWLLPGNCELCQQPHARAKPICTTCQAGFSLNDVSCKYCALPLKDRFESARVLARPRFTHLGSLSPQENDSLNTAAVTGERTLAAMTKPLLSCRACSLHPPDFDSTSAPFLMRTGIRSLIHLWKFQNRPQLTRLLAQLFIDAMANHGAQELAASVIHPPGNAPLLLVPIPTQRQRQIRRGFDHTWLLAQALHSLWCGDSTVCSALRNQQPRAAQHRMNRSDRLAHSEARFSARSTVSNRRVVLVDDVMTTGATARAAATVCRGAGAQTVQVWCLARTPDTPTAR